ncbi:PilZ domain-containing protein [Microvirga arabica]|nr:PilZ domain-containing protein [Microvirga arabica]
MNHVMPERRSGERVPAGLEGWFASETTGDPVACTVWDLSETGARLVIPAAADVPLEFQLRIPHEGTVARVRLLWTAGSHYGVKFTD